ncbi:hypothetical protein BaRGS_00014475 [Batillaria attramentaria]|uniref:Uncharacterized protein n=1 Tax=Batillaria attramentaria TaxID=370345 RepID=A0ABD0L4P5_9CAEN
MQVHTEKPSEVRNSATVPVKKRQKKILARCMGVLCGEGWSTELRKDTNLSEISKSFHIQPILHWQHKDRRTEKARELHIMFTEWVVSHGSKTPQSKTDKQVKVAR